MEFGKLGRFSHECFLADLFPEAVRMKESDVRRDEEESEEKREEEVDEEEGKVSHIF